MLLSIITYKETISFIYIALGWFLYLSILGMVLYDTNPFLKYKFF